MKPIILDQFYKKMKAFINEQMKQGFSVEFNRKYKPCVFLSKERLSFNSRITKSYKASSEQLSRVQNKPHLSHSEQIIFIKQQIKKLRTQTPHVYYTNSQKPLLFSAKHQKDKGKEDISKLVLSKLRKERSKQYDRKLKKSRVILPKLDMQGKSCWSPKKNRFIISWAEEKEQQKPEEHHPLEKAIRYKKVSKPHLAKPSNSFTFKNIAIKERGQSVVGGWEKNTLNEQEHELLYC